MRQLNLSNIVYGTMRLHERSLSVKDVHYLFDKAIDNGITSFHISPEYGSFELVSNVLKKLDCSKKSNVQVICKVSSPHFDEVSFDHELLRKKIKDILLRIGFDCMDVVQWMWRMNPLDDVERITRFNNDLQDIKNSKNILQEEAIIREFGCFPYSGEFMNAVQESGISDIHIDYLNFFESALIDSASNATGIALRPFFAGKVFELNNKIISKFNEIAVGDHIFHSLNFVLKHPKVSSAVVGLSSEEHLDNILSSEFDTESSLSTFRTYQDILMCEMSK